MKVMVEIDNRCEPARLPAADQCRRWLEETLDFLELEGRFSVSLQYLTRTDATALNRRYRGKAAATNVLSFPAGLPAPVIEKLDFQPLGDIAICPELLAAEANEQNKALESHWAHMLVHGMLHLLGYDHLEQDAAMAMERIEIAVLNKFGISNPYLIG